MPDSPAVTAASPRPSHSPASPAPETAAFVPVSLPEASPVDPARLDALTAELTALFGADAVSRDPDARLTASTDWAHMSPVLSPLLPGGVADIVVSPPDADGIAAAVGAAHRHRVPITVRGQGTGNYGQAIPLFGGLVLDTSRANRVLAVEDGWITAEAGTSFVIMEKAALATGQELALMPSTVGSTIGGFIAGGAGGTGSIANGAVWDGYIRSLRVVPCTDDATPVDVPYPDNMAMSHAFGVSGVIATATVALRPARAWTAVFMSFPDLDSAVAAGEELFDLAPTPRLLSLDEAGVVATYRPPDPAVPADRVSLRGILTVDSVTTATKVVARHGGRVEAVRPKGPALVTSMSYNHATYRVRKVRPELTHLQCRGPGLTRRRAEVAEIAPESLIHLEGFLTDEGRQWAGMLFLRFDGVDSLYERMARLADVEVYVNDPHTWVLHNRVDQIREAARRFDPDGLLNPGKLPPA